LHPSIDVGLGVDPQLVEHAGERDRRLFDLDNEISIVDASFVEPMKLPDAQVDHRGDGSQNQDVESNPLGAEEEAEPGERRGAV
tara:strand:- start:58 stop:309 length:252 start_codon:yes stop_codon:yes gene_type:complete